MQLSHTTTLRSISLVVMANCASSIPAKRRKIRKGTFSCWECKNRKTRCHLEPGANSACQFCRRRGLACISQELPNPADNENAGLEVLDLPRKDVGNVAAAHKPPERAWGLPGATFDDSQELSSSLSFRLDHFRHNRTSLSQSSVVIREPLTDHLLAVLPDAITATLIMSRGKFFSLPIHVRRHSLQKLTSPIQNSGSYAQISELPSPSSHPLHFARKLIQLALCLQQLDPPTTARLEVKLKESVHEVAKRYVEIASRYVTSQDSLMQSQDGLGTLMLEACFHINVGNLRSAWLLFRRALSIAQLLGLPKPGASIDSCEEAAWFRLVFGDRFVSLMLGLPCVVPEDDFAMKDNFTESTMFEELERIHVNVLGRIIARNVRIQRRGRSASNNDIYNDYKETQNIDYSMKHAVKHFPASWWASPTFSSEATDAEIMDRTAQIMERLHHHFYLGTLHQPYVLYNTLTLSTTNSDREKNAQLDCSYSQITALSSSREVLSCFLSIRSHHRVLSYRPLDDKAYFAATGVILSHINGHRLGRENVLDHQRPQDLRLLNEVLNLIEDISLLSRDALSGNTVRTLKKLLAIEAQCAEGVGYDIWLEEDPNLDLETEREVLKVTMPYFGIVCLACQGSILWNSAHSNLGATHSESSGASTSPFTESLDQQNNATLPGETSLMQESSHSMFYEIQDNEPQYSTVFNLQSSDLSQIDNTIVEENWLSDVGTAFLDEWVDGENQIGSASFRLVA
jgi:hypothetical protein